MGFRCWSLIASVLVISLESQGLGLAERPGNPDCVAPPRPVSGAIASVAFEEFFGPSNVGAFSSAPIGMSQSPLDPDLWYVALLEGKVLRIDTSAEPFVKTEALDITADIEWDPSSGGLLGMALHPDFSQNGEVYLYYTADGGGGAHLVTLSRFTSNDSGVTLDPASELVLLTVLMPVVSNHEGGGMAFGTDGYLYVGVGDGAVSFNAQDTSTYPGSILRIDVDTGSPYAIPPNNPFASGGGAPEIYAYGLRNPWRISIDRFTGDLYAGDVGAADWEEINSIVSGGNYGWPIREGRTCYQAETCDATGLIDPVFDYDHSVGTAIVGGFVYRGNDIPALYGTYVFANLSPGIALALVYDEHSEPSLVPLGQSGDSFVSISEDLSGEFYFHSYSQKRVLKMVELNPEPTSFPALLSQTGCMDASDPTLPGPGLVPYGVNVKLWSDGATKERWFAIPDGVTIDVQPDGDFTLPNGSVAVKHFRIGTQLVETRLFVRHDDGGYAGYSYKWNDLQTDAALLSGSSTKVVGGQTWTYPSRTDCLQCHTAAASGFLGLEQIQLDGDFTYPVTAETANQVEALDSVGFFTAPLVDLGDPPPAIDDLGEPLAKRARGYLHANCSQCHRPGHPIEPEIDFRFASSDEDMNACNVLPVSGTMGQGPLLRLIAPGDPSHSVLSLRVHDLDQDRMPPLGSAVVDPTGTSLIDDWITNWIPTGGTCPPPPDADADTYPDAWDNCPAAANEDQLNADNDTEGDACDDDDDDDGLPDAYENLTGVYVSPTETGTDPLQADSDGDGFDDLVEIQMGTDPNDATSNITSLPSFSWIAMTALATVLGLSGVRASRRTRCLKGAEASSRLS